MSNKTLNLTPEVYQYYRNHAGQEPEVLANLRAYTLDKFANQIEMQIAPEQGLFMRLLLKAISAKNVLEIGTFTGYSAISMALGLPEDGKIITCDINPEFTTVAADFSKKARVENKLEIKLGPASQTLKMLLASSSVQPFDFAFIDADKTGYDFYYESCLQLLRPGGIIAIDNTLQNGAVADPSDHQPNTEALRQLNHKLMRDTRILLSMLPIADGLTLVYKLTTTT